MGDKKSKRSHWFIHLFGDFLLSDDDDDAPPPPSRPLRLTLNTRQQEEIVDKFNNNQAVQPFAGNIRQYFANIEEFQNSLIYRFLTPTAKALANVWYNQ